MAVHMTSKYENDMHIFKILDVKGQDCQDCGGIFMRSCQHSYGYCHCKDVFRGHCIFCLFDGTEDYDEWLDGQSPYERAIRAVELGKLHRKEELYPCKTKHTDVKSLHKLFTIGWKSK